MQYNLRDLTFSQLFEKLIYKKIRFHSSIRAKGSH